MSDGDHVNVGDASDDDANDDDGHDHDASAGDERDHDANVYDMGDDDVNDVGENVYGAIVYDLVFCGKSGQHKVVLCIFQNGLHAYKIFQLGLYVALQQN